MMKERKKLRNFDAVLSELYIGQPAIITSGAVCLKTSPVVSYQIIKDKSVVVETENTIYTNAMAMTAIA